MVNQNKIFSFQIKYQLKASLRVMSKEQERPIKGILANNEDPDKTPQNAASDQGLHSLHKIQEFL